MRIGAAEQGLNPYGATMTPYGAQQSPAPFQPPQPQIHGHGPPPGPPPGGAPHGYAPPAGGSPHSAAPPTQGSVPGALHVPAPAQPRSHDPSAFAATAPPPTTDEFDAAKRGQSPQAPPVAQPSGMRSSPSAGQQSARDPEQVEPNAPRTIAGFLVAYETETGEFWPIFQGQNVVGRRGASPGLHIEIDHPTTSSRHALLLASARPGRVKLEDLGSTNGTFVGDQQLERGRKHELRDGDKLRFGGLRVIVKIV